MLVLTLLFPSSPEVPFKLRCEMSIQIAVVPLGNRIHVTNMSFCFLEIVPAMASALRDEQSTDSEAEEVAELGDADVEDPRAPDHPVAPWNCEEERMSLRKFKEMEDAVFQIWSSQLGSVPTIAGGCERGREYAEESFACFNDAVFNTTRQAYEILRYWGGKLLALPRPPPDERSGEILEQLQKVNCVLHRNDVDTKRILDCMLKDLLREDAPDRRYRQELGFSVSRLRKGGYKPSQLGDITDALLKQLSPDDDTIKGQVDLDASENEGSKKSLESFLTEVGDQFLRLEQNLKKEGPACLYKKQRTSSHYEGGKERAFVEEPRTFPDPV
ncbi:hypothetical protein AK812_SmicGene29555 [Symbiodinium microadriaticum]|uniref:Uncharacterized protein n=1 Tax=Symbiodinium microadriaticum TaxID=2951 RepID=A0A1Q9D1H3_SYMMI|nr:hypothetical protein AK812_SmicGene29555 [Symbiodinium microadriaticum]